MDEVSPQIKRARLCTNPDCEYGGRWIIGKMTRTKNGKLLCTGKGCHRIYEPGAVIDPESDDYRLWVARPS